MHTFIRPFLFVLALTLAIPALAQVAGTVEGVQMPAWMQRAGGRLPILPGTQLRAGDEVATGAGARLLIKLAEGSVVKLGENAQMSFSEVAPSADLFRAALNVLQGAFRFTTDVVSKARTRRGGAQAPPPPRGEHPRLAGHRRHPWHGSVGPLARRQRDRVPDRRRDR